MVETEMVKELYQPLQSGYEGILKYLPEIIISASSSNLGIVALMLILFSALAYIFFRNSPEIWRLIALFILFVGCIAFGVAIFRTTTGSMVQKYNHNLLTTMQIWIAEAEHARKESLIDTGIQIPLSLKKAKDQFEIEWREASLVEKKSIDQDVVYKSIVYATILYRILERDSSQQPNATYWANEAINYFEEIQSKKYLTKSLLNKAAIYLDILRLENDEKRFRFLARSGAGLMEKAFQISDEEQRSVVLRMSSRFYYDLAKPEGLILAKGWDDDLLFLAYEKAMSAYKMDRSDILNAIQLARTAIKASKNQSQYLDKTWTSRLRDSQRKLKDLWLKNKSAIVKLTRRLEIQNVLGVCTLEAIAREWHELNTEDKKYKSYQYIKEIDSDSLSLLCEASELLQNTELKKSFGFDLYYDIARARAVKVAMLKIGYPQLAGKEFEQLRKSLRSAKRFANRSDIESALIGINNDVSFLCLTKRERSILSDTIYSNMQ